MVVKSLRGIQEDDVWIAADELVAQGLRPTIERVRLKIGRGSPNTVSPMLERWFATLGKRLEHSAIGVVDEEGDKLPPAVIQAARGLWDRARAEAAQAEVEASQARRRALDMQHAELVQPKAELQQREAALQEARASREAAAAAAESAFDAMKAQWLEARNALTLAEAELQRLRQAVEESRASKDALWEQLSNELATRDRAATEAAERHAAQERRWLGEIDRERQATRAALGELAKTQKTREAEQAQALAALQSSQDRVQATEQIAQALRSELAAAQARATQADTQLRTTGQLLEDTQDRMAQEQRAHDATRGLLAGALAHSQSLPRAGKKRNERQSDPRAEG